MAMTYAETAIPDASVPQAAAPIFQHLLDTYAGEINKVSTVWGCFSEEDLAFRIHPKSSTVQEILKHQLLSERRFFAEFLGLPEPAPADLLPKDAGVSAFRRQLCELALPRFGLLASKDQAWW